MKVILASASPRRRELLSNIFDDFTVLPAKDEAQMPEGLSPGDGVAFVALSKARAVASLCKKDDLIVASDTMVYLENKLLGKPADEREAFNMLSALSGNRHTVYTGIALKMGHREVSSFEAADVYFSKLTESEIKDYIASGEPMDKAGAYGAQGKGSLFVERIDGDFFTVMGLPVNRLYNMLKDFGVMDPDKYLG